MISFLVFFRKAVGVDYIPIKPTSVYYFEFFLRSGKSDFFSILIIYGVPYYFVALADLSGELD